MKKILNYTFVLAIICLSCCLFIGCNKQYDITIAQTQNGTIYTNRAKANVGDKIIISVFADDGYILQPGSLKINDKTIDGFEFEMPENNVVVSAKFVPAEFSVDYHTNQWTTHQNPLSINSQSEIVLQNATRPGYHFEGWYSDENLTTKITKIEKGTKNNISVYPKFNQIFVVNVGASYVNISDLTEYGNTLENLIVPSEIDGNKITTFSIQKPCPNVKTLTIEDGVSSIVAYLTLWGSEKLETVNLPKSINVSPYNSPLFKNCTSLTTINLDPQNQNIYQKDGVIYKYTSGTHYQIGHYEHVYVLCYPNGKTNSSFVIPDEVTHLNDFGKAKFSSVVISKNVISCLSQNPFAECENLTQISVDSNNSTYVANQNNLYQITDNNSTIGRCTLIFSVSTTKTLDLTKNFVANGKEYRITDVFETAFNQSSVEKFIVNFELIDVDIFEKSPNVKMLSTCEKPTPKNWSEQDRYADVLSCNNIYWYNETTPTQSGNYWHYDAQNNAVLWG